MSRTVKLTKYETLRYTTVLEFNDDDVDPDNPLLQDDLLEDQDALAEYVESNCLEMEYNCEAPQTTYAAEVIE